MRIGVIGAGRVGSTLGRGLAAAGHAILYGVRDPHGAERDALAHANAEVTTVRDAVARAEVVILATPWNAAEAALQAAGDFAGKPLLDATNPIGPGMTLTHGHADSGAEQVARWARNARVVKVFNTTGAENMGDPVYGQDRLVMFACGDDDEACTTALALARALGFDAHRFGGLANARILEPVAMLWIKLAMTMGHGRSFGFVRARR